MGDIELLVISIFVIIDEALESVGLENRPGPKPDCPDSVLITAFILQYLKGYESDSAWLRCVNREYRHIFKNLPSRARYQRRRVRLEPLVQQMTLFILMKISVLVPDSLIDSAPLPVCHNIRAKNNPAWIETAAWGRCASKKEWLYGFKLHLLTTLEGLPRAWKLLPANIHDSKGLKEVIAEFRDLIIFGDKGYLLKKADRDELTQTRNIEIVAQPKSNMKPLPVDQARKLKTYRPRIEQTFSLFDRVFDGERTLALKFSTLNSRVAFKLLAFNVGALINKQKGNNLRDLAPLAA